MRHNVIVRAVLFTGLASLLLDPNAAEAQFEQRVPPTACVAAPNRALYYVADGTAQSPAGGAPGGAFCPLQDNSAHPFYNADYATLFINDNGRRSPAEHSAAQLCVTPYGVDGAFCGSLVTSPAFGYQELPLDTGYWNTTLVSGFPYVYVHLGYWTGGAGGPSSIEGITVGY